MLGIRAGKFVPGIAAVAACITLALGLTACGGKQSSAASPQLSDRNDGSQATEELVSQSIDQTLTELEEMECPEGVDEELWVEMKDALGEALTKRAWNHGRDARATSEVPTGEANRIDDLTILDNGDGTFTLTWHYQNLGDYDQNGAVGIEDITPLAIHFGEEVPEGDSERNSIQAVVDGSGNNVVDIADITPIAQNFQREVHHYAVEGVDDYEQPYIEVAQVQLPGHDNTARLELTHDLGVPPYRYWRVVPVDAEDNRGQASNVVSTQPGEPPQIISVSPTEGDSGTEATFSAEVTGDGPFTYYWDFAGGASPNESSVPAPTVTLSRGGTLPEPVHAYSAALTVNTPYGAASYPFSLNISAWWHIEEIPKVPGHEDDEIELALYDYGPDGSLWGIHCYPGKYMYLIRWLGETFEYEQLPWDNVYDYITYLEVDREGRPAVLGELYTGILQWTPFFAIRTPEGWEKEDIAGTGQLLFDSANQPVIVYTLDSSAIWVARRTAPGEWERKCAVSDVSPVSYVTVALDDEDRVHMAFSSSDRMYYIRETADTWQLKTTADFYMDHDGALHKFHPLDLGLSAEGTVRALFAERFPVGAAYSDTIWFSDITEGLAWELVDSYVSEAGLLQGMEQLADIDGLVIATFRHPLESVQKIAWRLSGIWEVGTIAPDVYGGELKVIPPDGYAVVASGALAVYW